MALSMVIGMVLFTLGDYTAAHTAASADGIILKIQNLNLQSVNDLS